MSLNVQLGILIFVHDELSVDCCCCVDDNDGAETEDEGEEVQQGEQVEHDEQGEEDEQVKEFKDVEELQKQQQHYMLWISKAKMSRTDHRQSPIQVVTGPGVQQPR